MLLSPWLSAADANPDVAHLGYGWGAPIHESGMKSDSCSMIPQGYQIPAIIRPSAILSRVPRPE